MSRQARDHYREQKRKLDEIADGMSNTDKDKTGTPYDAQTATVDAASRELSWRERLAVGE